MCSCHSIPECCVMFSGVKLSLGSFVLSSFQKIFSIVEILVDNKYLKQPPSL